MPEQLAQMHQNALAGLTTEAWPSVVFDTGVGKLALNTEVDIQYIANVLSLSGMTDEQITQATLHFTDETIVDDIGTPEEELYFGDYDPDTHIARVHLGTMHYLLTESRVGIKDDLKENPGLMDYLYSIYATEYAFHELHHELEENVLGSDALQEESFDHYGIRTKLKLVTRLALWVASWQSTDEKGQERLLRLVDELNEAQAQMIARKYMRAKRDTDKYLDSPSEIRARNFSENLIKLMDGEDFNFPVDLVMAN